MTAITQTHLHSAVTPYLGVSRMFGAHHGVHAWRPPGGAQKTPPARQIPCSTLTTSELWSFLCRNKDTGIKVKRQSNLTHRKSMNEFLTAWSYHAAQPLKGGRHQIHFPQTESWQHWFILFCVAQKVRAARHTHERWSFGQKLHY